MEHTVRRILWVLAFIGFCSFAVNYTGWFSRYLLLVFLLLPLLSLLYTLPAALLTAVSVSVPRETVRETDAAITVSVRRAPHLLRLPVEVRIRQTDLTASPPTVSRTKKRFLPVPPARPQKSARRNRPAEDRDPASADGSMDLKLAISAPEETPGIRIPLDTAHTALLSAELLSVRISDPLGLFSLPVRGTKHRGSLYPVLVLPRPAAPAVPPRRRQMQDAVWVPARGFSEQTDIRPYRPGDPMRSVHWKLSAKTDSVLVRDPVEHPRTTVGITVERTPDRSAADTVFDRLSYLLDDLCRDSGVLCILTAWKTEDGAVRFGEVRTPADISPLFEALLSGGTPALPVTAEDMKTVPFPRPVHEVLHISPDGSISASRAADNVPRLGSAAPEVPERSRS